MELQGHGFPKSIPKIKTVRAKHVGGATFIFGENPDTRWELPKPLYGLATACREWYGDLKISLTGLGGEVAILEKSVST